MTKHFLFIFLLVMCIFRSMGQQIPASRITDWSNPGCETVYESPTEINAVHFGLDNTGNTASDSVFEELLNSVSGAKTIFFPEGIYLFERTIVLPDSVTLKGEADAQTLRSKVLFRLAPPLGGHGILIQGAQTNINEQVTHTLQKGNRKIKTPQNETFSEGEYIRLFAMDDTLLTNNSWAYNTTGQLLKIIAIEADSLVFEKPFRRDYVDLERLPMLYRFLPKTQVHIWCIDMEMGTETTVQTSNIFFDMAANCSVSGVDSRMSNFAHITIQASHEITVTNSHFKDGFSYGGGGKAYGVVLQATTSDCYIYANSFDHLRHSVLLQSGPNGNVVAYNYSVNPYWTETSLPSNSAGDIVLHGNYPYMNLFEGNVVQHIVIDNSHGINGPYNTFFRNRAELYGLFMNNSPASDSQNFIGNQITNTAFFMGLYSLQGSGHYEYGNSVKGAARPAGTGEYPEATMFGYQFSSYYDYFSSVPPIMQSNWNQSVRFNEASSRFVNDNKSVCGNIEYEQPNLSVAENITADVGVYPNPTSGAVIVDADNMKNIDVYSLAGMVLLSCSQTIVDLTGFPSGVYIFKITTENSVLCRKVIKE